MNEAMKRPRISVIVARARNGVIGRDNALPWKLSNDLQFFKRQTLGKAIVMGRKTFESIGRPLPGRLNVVITRSGQWQAEGVLVVHSLEEALEQGLVAAAGQGMDDHEIVVIGGAELYRQAIPLAHRLILTEVEVEPEGDAWFDAPNATEWQEVFREQHPADDKNEYPHAFVIYERHWLASGDS